MFEIARRTWCAQLRARAIAASPRCRSRVFARISKRKLSFPSPCPAALSFLSFGNDTDPRGYHRLRARGHAKITRRATGERARRPEKRLSERNDRFLASTRETEREIRRVTKVAGDDRGQRERAVERSGAERGERRTLVTVRSERARIRTFENVASRRMCIHIHLPISGNMLGWSSSDLRLFSTRVGEERSLSLISRTAPRSLQAHTSGLCRSAHAETHSMAHTAHE